MRIRPRYLLNTPDVELWPAHLLQARANATARALAGATHVIRRKCDGRYLAASGAAGIVPLAHDWPRHARTRDVRHLLAADATGTPGEHDLPLAHITQRLAALGLDDGYAARTGLALVAEPSSLVFADRDRYHRPFWLRRAPARAWRVMRDAARRDGVLLEAISGYRSHDYQLGIFERKLARGQTVEQILTVNAAPGYSEHHSGRALDLSTPGEPAAEESFEHTAAFAWLRDHAASHGFVMSYPRDNPHGIVYEPWHWCHVEDDGAPAGRARGDGDGDGDGDGEQ